MQGMITPTPAAWSLKPCVPYATINCSCHEYRIQARKSGGKGKPSGELWACKSVRVCSPQALTSSVGEGVSVASASAPSVSMIRFTHNSCTPSTHSKWQSRGVEREHEQHSPPLQTPLGKALNAGNI